MSLAKENGLSPVVSSISMKPPGKAHFPLQGSFFRCMPQVHGASKDTIAYVKSVVDIEVNAATDNPTDKW